MDLSARSADAEAGLQDGFAWGAVAAVLRATAVTYRRERLSGTAGGVDGKLATAAVFGGEKTQRWTGALG